MSQKLIFKDFNCSKKLMFLDFRYAKQFSSTNERLIAKQEKKMLTICMLLQCNEVQLGVSAYVWPSRGLRTHIVSLSLVHCVSSPFICCAVHDF